MPNYITYKQADSRWGKKNYNGSSSMATAGCGPTSVAMLAYAVDGKTNPWDVALYMKKNGYAIRNNGTAWSGIPAAMKNFGLKDVKEVNVNTSMTAVWDYLKKGYCAVFLFKAGSRGAVTWTNAGHYIAVTGYKYENKKHYLYTRDSGGRNHTGWYCYETQMRGLIPKVWVGKVGGTAPKPAPTPAKKYTGTLPTLPKRGYFKVGDKSSQVTLMQKFLIWAGFSCGKAGADSIYGNGTKAAVKRFEQAYGLSPVDGLWGKKCQKQAQSMTETKPAPKPTPAPTKTNADKIVAMAKKCAWPYGTAKSKYAYPNGSPTADFNAAIAKAYPDRSKWGKQTRAGASCDVFAGTVIRASGVDPKFPRGLDGVVKHCKGNSKWQLTGVKSVKDMKPGDVVYMEWKGGGHIYIYLGNDRCANAHYVGKSYGIIQKASDQTKSASKCQIFNVYRAK